MAEFRAPHLWTVVGTLADEGKPPSSAVGRTVTFGAAAFEIAAADAADAADALRHNWSAKPCTVRVQSLTRVPNGEGLAATRIIVRAMQPSL